MHVLGQVSAAQDVVQEVRRPWRQPQRYDPTLGTLRTYLTLSARHRAYDLLRSELRRSVVRSATIGSSRHSARPRRRSAVDAPTASAVREPSVPSSERRQVVEMAYFGGLSYRDVARAVGISEGTAKSRSAWRWPNWENMPTASRWSRHDHPCAPCRCRPGCASACSRPRGRPARPAERFPHHLEITPSRRSIDAPTPSTACCACWTTSSGTSGCCAISTSTAWSTPGRRRGPLPGGTRRRSDRRRRRPRRGDAVRCPRAGRTDSPTRRAPHLARRRRRDVGDPRGGR